MFQTIKQWRSWTALLLAGAIFLTGCGQGQNLGQDSGQDGQTQAGAEGTGAAFGADSGSGNENGEKSMGRYLESEIELPEEARAAGSYSVAYLGKLDSGELALLEQTAGLYLLEDNGETWKSQETPWLSQIQGSYYISDMALAPSGAAAVIYDESKKEAENAQYEPKYFYVDPEGNRKDIVFEYQQSLNYLHGFWFDQDSNLYATDMNQKVYEVNKDDGTMKELFETQGLVDYICFTQNYIITFSSGEIAVYDKREGQLSDQSAVFQDYVVKNAGHMIGNTDIGHAVIAVEGETDDVIYFAYDGGLYRYIMGGAAIEQVIDGNTCSLGDPSLLLLGMAVLPDNEFVVLYEDMKLCRYTYDPNVPTVPEERITVYSLTENYSMRQAVSLFQKEHQNVYIKYEIGMSGQDGLTQEDAIKNLNTKIMSDSGPDILVMDGLPTDSYQEKGIFADIGSIANNMVKEDSLFPNIAEACREDGKIYALPMRIQLPMIIGDAQDLETVKDLGTLADTMETLREKNPEGSLLGLKTEEQLLYTLGLTSSAAWVKEDGSLDQKALTEFLTDAARIYQAEIAGFDPEEMKDEQEQIYQNQVNISTPFSSENQYYATASSGAIDIAMGKRKLAAGKVSGVEIDLNLITTVATLENLSYKLWAGQVPDGFIPDCMVGIYSGSAKKELVLEFYRFLFGRKVQDMDLSGGFPVNMASLETFAQSPRGNEDNGGIALVGEGDGEMFSLDVEWVKEEDFNRLKEILGKVSHISTGNPSIGQAVYESGAKALKGDMTVEDAVKEIEKKSALYLAE